MSPLQLLSFFMGGTALILTAMFAFKSEEHRRQMVERLFTEKPSLPFMGIVLSQFVLLGLSVIFSLPKVSILGAFLMLVTFFGVLKAVMMLFLYKYLRSTFLMLMTQKVAMAVLLVSSAAISIVLLIFPWFSASS